MLVHRSHQCFGLNLSLFGDGSTSQTNFWASMFKVMFAHQLHQCWVNVYHKRYFWKWFDCLRQWECSCGLLCSKGLNQICLQINALSIFFQTSCCYEHTRVFWVTYWIYGFFLPRQNKPSYTNTPSYRWLTETSISFARRCDKINMVNRTGIGFARLCNKMSVWLVNQHKLCTAMQ